MIIFFNDIRISEYKQYLIYWIKVINLPKRKKVTKIFTFENVETTRTVRYINKEDAIKIYEHIVSKLNTNKFCYRLDTVSNAKYILSLFDE